MLNSSKHFDCIVIGGGHAGLEAVRALSSMGQRVALVTLDINKIGAMSCNPAIGGVAKSHLVYEMDALGGLMGVAADSSGIQSRRLNMNKGPAVRATRIQCDKNLYSKFMQNQVQKLENVCIVQSEASGLLFENHKISGILLADNTELYSRAVIVTAGTFMQGLMFCGSERTKGGRFGDAAADRLTHGITKIGHSVLRLKTGTPARLDARSIDFTKLEKQWGDSEQRYFSWKTYLNKDSEISHTRLPQMSCYLTYTNEKTHDIIRDNFHQSPLFSGDIAGIGPRYCPSVEDKVKRFGDRPRHQIFLEPEGLNTNSIYPNGLSTSLPADVQLAFLRTIEGLEKVELLRPGYAVEYDSFDPTQLNNGFMSKFAQGLFFAGQVNRTSGYEEAAAQGLWAGINAACFLQGRDFVNADRSRSYLETLASDLTTVGTEEPYRMFTSRSEYRLLLREDNAGERMFMLACELGLLSDAQKSFYETQRQEAVKCRDELLSKRIRISDDRMISYYEYLRRPEISWEGLGLHEGSLSASLAIEKVEIEAKYAGYVEKQESELRELRSLRKWNIGESFDVHSISGLSREVVEKFLKAKPKNIEELLRISGITPAAALLLARKACTEKTRPNHAL